MKKAKRGIALLLSVLLVCKIGKHGDSTRPICIRTLMFLMEKILSMK